MDGSFAPLPQLAGGREFTLALPLLFVLLVGGARAQASSAADSSGFRPYQIGVSAGAFVEFLGDADAPEQYQVYGRYRLTRDWAFRTALRYEQLFSDGQTLDLVARIGADLLLHRDGPVQVYGGTDLVAGYHRLPSENRTYRIGGAPVIGLLVFVTPNISVSLEPRLVALYSYFDNRAQFSDDAHTVSVELKGEGFVILSVHF